jgi:hypothetical protein
MKRRDVLTGAAVAASSLAAPGLVRRALAQEGFTALLRAEAQKGSMIFRGGPILTINPRVPSAEAVLVLNDRIAAVGSADQIEDLRGANTKIIDLVH